VQTDRSSETPRPRKARGAVSNPQGRFEAEARETIDDGWTREDEPTPEPATTVTEERARSIISKNDSPDIPFEQSINPYRGCEHGCVYCLSGDTQILMADGRTKPLAEVRVGDEIYGTERRGWYRRYVKSRVLAHWQTIKPAYRLTLEDGTTLVASADHRFLTDRGWKHVRETDNGGSAQRPHLTTNNKLMGTGAFATRSVKNDDYRLGYLGGMIRGDGLLASYHYQRSGRTHGDQHQFRLALCDIEALQRTEEYLFDLQIRTGRFVFQEAVVGRRDMHAIRTHARASVERIRELIEWPTTPSTEWFAGFLAGIFDAEGSYSHHVLRISNTDREIIGWIGRCLRAFGFRFTLEHPKREQLKPIDVARLDGGLQEHLRFFHTVDPAITRKMEIAGQALKGNARLRVVSIDPVGKALRLYDITTRTGDFIANGVVSHNCYARPSHSYLELSPGLDFETKLFAKTNAAELLKAELARPGYKVTPIMLGANTDCYQPIERKFKITRQVLEILAECQHPVTIVTKGALIERDLDLLGPMGRNGLAEVYVSLATLDRVVARRLEPRAASPQRRLDTIRALSSAGVPTGVLVAPIIPALTDTTIEAVIEAAHAAGASSADYTLLRLPNELKGLFREWLATHYPQRADHVMSIVRDMRGGRDNDPNFGSRMRGTGNFAELLRARFSIARKRHGLDRRSRERIDLDCTKFRPPAVGGQMQLF
jgi:DNA repair photolyase